MPDNGAYGVLEHLVITRCPVCSKPLRDLERVEARHTPASVPEYAKGYGIVRRYTITACENDHRFEAYGGKDPMGWRSLKGGNTSTVWNVPGHHGTRR